MVAGDGWGAGSGGDGGNRGTTLWTSSLGGVSEYSVGGSGGGFTSNGGNGQVSASGPCYGGGGGDGYPSLTGGRGSLFGDNGGGYGGGGGGAGTCSGGGGYSGGNGGAYGAGAGGRSFYDTGIGSNFTASDLITDGNGSVYFTCVPPVTTTPEPSPAAAVTLAFLAIPAWRKFRKLETS